MTSVLLSRRIREQWQWLRWRARQCASERFSLVVVQRLYTKAATGIRDRGPPPLLHIELWLDLLGDLIEICDVSTDWGEISELSLTVVPTTLIKACAEAASWRSKQSIKMQRCFITPTCPALPKGCAVSMFSSRSCEGPSLERTMRNDTIDAFTPSASRLHDTSSGTACASTTF